MSTTHEYSTSDISVSHFHSVPDRTRTVPVTSALAGHTTTQDREWKLSDPMSAPKARRGQQPTPPPGAATPAEELFEALPGRRGRAHGRLARAIAGCREPRWRPRMRTGPSSTLRHSNSSSLQLLTRIRYRRSEFSAGARSTGCGGSGSARCGDRGRRGGPRWWSSLRSAPACPAPCVWSAAAASRVPLPLQSLLGLLAAVFVSLEWSVGRMCRGRGAGIDTYDLTFLLTRP